MIKAKYFKEAEFKKCNPPCSLRNMDQKFIETLDKVREAAGIPLVLNSAYRSVEHEKKMGRKGTSAHTLGKAADIRANKPETKFKIVKAALEQGITRIGVAGTYVHLDIATVKDGKAQEVMWTY